MLLSENPLQQSLNRWQKLNVVLECSDLFYCKQILEVSLKVLEAKLTECMSNFK